MTLWFIFVYEVDIKPKPAQTSQEKSNKNEEEKAHSVVEDQSNSPEESGTPKDPGVTPDVDMDVIPDWKFVICSIANLYDQIFPEGKDSNIYSSLLQSIVSYFGPFGEAVVVAGIRNSTENKSAKEELLRDIDLFSKEPYDAFNFSNKVIDGVGGQDTIAKCIQNKNEASNIDAEYKVLEHTIQNVFEHPKILNTDEDGYTVKHPLREGLEVASEDEIQIFDKGEKNGYKHVFRDRLEEFEAEKLRKEKEPLIDDMEVDSPHVESPIEGPGNPVLEKTQTPTLLQMKTGKPS